MAMMVVPFVFFDPGKGPNEIGDKGEKHERDCADQLPLLFALLLAERCLLLGFARGGFG